MTAPSLADPHSPPPEQLVMNRELAQAVERALWELPVQQRAALELRSLGHSLVEMAQMLEISHANARVQLHRARATLAARLKSFLEQNVS